LLTMKKIILILILLNIVTLSIWGITVFQKKRRQEDHIQKMDMITQRALESNARKNGISSDDSQRLFALSGDAAAGNKLDRNDLSWFLQFCLIRMSDRKRDNEVSIVLITPVLSSWKLYEYQEKDEIVEFCKKMMYSDEGYNYKSIGISQIALMQLPESKELLYKYVATSDSENARKTARKWLDVYEGKSFDDRVKIK
jgi:hypothetical protein